MKFVCILNKHKYLMLYFLDKALLKELVMNVIEQQSNATAKTAKQVDAIFALEGLNPDGLTEQFRRARADGKISSHALGEELLNYVERNKSLEGFAESRSWLR